MARLSPIAILAGGLATRLRPITQNVPKSLVPVAGKPFIAHQLTRLRDSGADHIVLCVGYFAEQIADFVGDGSQFGLKVEYSFDGERQLGTGGALLKALPMLGDKFFVMYGDSYLETPLATLESLFEKRGKQGLMVVYRNEGKYDTSNVVFSDGTVKRYDKKNITSDMRHIDYGLGMLHRLAFEGRIVNRPFDLADIYTILAGKGELGGFEVHQRFYEIGSIEGLRQTRDYFLAESTH